MGTLGRVISCAGVGVCLGGALVGAVYSETRDPAAAPAKPAEDATRSYQFRPYTVLWAVGDRWEIEIEQLSLREPDEGAARLRPTASPTEVVEARYRMQVRVSGTAIVDGHDCWEVDFLPGEGAPAEIKARAWLC